MALVTPGLAAEAAAAPAYPTLRFNNRERKLLRSVKDYLDAGLSTAQIADSAVTLAKLAPGVKPSHIVKFGGTFTTAGGDAFETIAVAGALATDLAVVTVKTLGGTPRSVTAAAAAANQINVTMSGDPSTDHVLYYTVYRVAT